MDDLISRQDAIDAHCELCADKDTCSGDICPDVEVFQLLPSVQPDLSGYSDRLWKAAYERGKAEAQLEPSQVARDIATIIENEQDMRVIERNDIVRCKDCKHNPKDEWFGCPMSHLSEKQRPETAWCWKGERRSDG